MRASQRRRLSLIRSRDRVRTPPCKGNTAHKINKRTRVRLVLKDDCFNDLSENMFWSSWWKRKLLFRSKVLTLTTSVRSFNCQSNALFKLKSLLFNDPYRQAKVLIAKYEQRKLESVEHPKSLTEESLTMSSSEAPRLASPISWLNWAKLVSASIGMWPSISWHRSGSGV